MHNEPTDGEIALVRAFAQQHPGHLRHIVAVPVEPLAVSMNRAIEAASGDLLTIWNVDDLRTDNSLELQLRTMDDDPNAIATYGDYDVVTTFGSTHGRRDTYPAYDPDLFTRGMYGSCFPMWRRTATRAAGMFDEQLLQGADFDLFVRLAFHGRMRKTEGLLGWYLNEGRGLASRPGTLQPLERTVIQLRYGMYRTIDFRHYRRARQYRIGEILHKGSWIPVGRFVPSYDDVMRRRRRDLPFGLAYFVAVHVLRAHAGRLKRWMLPWVAQATKRGGLPG